MNGRFTSPDEFKGGPDELFDFEEDASDNPTFYADLENPQSLNKYQYGYNNPYKYNDPSGHCPLGICVWGPPASRTADRVVNGVLRVAQATGVTAAATAALTAVDGAIRRGGIERDNTAAGRMAQSTERRLLDNYDARQRQNQPQILMNAQVGGSTSKKTTKATAPYKRPNNATTKEQRKSVQGKPCVDCGKTTSKQVANHKKPLVKEHYQTGTIDKKKMRAVKSVNSQCPTCSSKQGGKMSNYSKEMKKKIGQQE